MTGAPPPQNRAPRPAREPGGGGTARAAGSGLAASPPPGGRQIAPAPGGMIPPGAERADEMFRVVVIGFCDVVAKRPGFEDCILFNPADCFEASLPFGPTMTAELIAYATACGLYPSGLPGAEQGKCDPLWTVAVGP
jgi:hypothetical protein